MPDHFRNVKAVKFLRQPPPGRTAESIERQFIVEKGLADRLRNSKPEERKNILSTMYDELFAKVPEHSRLTRRSDPEKTRQYNRSKAGLLRRFLNPNIVFLEFGSGDCQFAEEIAKQAKEVIGVDISDQRDPAKPSPPNFRLVTYDGTNLDSIASDSVDLAFSDQLLEHLHPEDAQNHIALIFRILRKGGNYVLRTPHAHSGPHDISKYFCYEPQGFHLKEWTFTELRAAMLAARFSRVTAMRSIRGTTFNIPFLYLTVAEKLIGSCPGAVRKFLAGWFIPTVLVAATK